MAFFKAKGYQIKGIDFSSSGVESKNSRCLDYLITGDIFELLKNEIQSKNNFSVIWLQNVLEHVLDPMSLLKSLRSLVAPGGVVAITVPNDFSILQRSALEKGFISKPFWLAFPDHISYFDHKSLCNAARQAGWEVADTISDFPVDWFLCNSNSNYVNDSSKGKAAHNAKVDIENIIFEKPIQEVANLWRAMAKADCGRNLTIFITPKR
jgi:SAM-dependent methyltransferase